MGWKMGEGVEGGGLGGGGGGIRVAGGGSPGAVRTLWCNISAPDGVIRGNPEAPWSNQPGGGGGRRMGRGGEGKGSILIRRN